MAVFTEQLLKDSYIKNVMKESMNQILCNLRSMQEAKQLMPEMDTPDIAKTLCIICLQSEGALMISKPERQCMDMIRTF